MRVLLSIIALVLVASVHSMPSDSGEDEASENDEASEEDEASKVDEASEEDVANRDGICDCESDNMDRIVGGKDARRNQYPFIAAIENILGTHYCGGAIITAYHILTAGHCVAMVRSPNQIQVRVGVHNLYQGEGVVHRIGIIVIHEEFDLLEGLNDIGLLVTLFRIRFGYNVRPACLPSKRLSLAGEHLTALGWGRLGQGGRTSDTLQEVDLTVITFAECLKTWYGFDMTPTRNNICTHEFNKDTCQGDSGGPLVWHNPRTHRIILAALVSFGGKCAGNQASPNTDVSAFLDWIHTTIRATSRRASACVRD